MATRKHPLFIGGIYHIFTRSIAGFRILDQEERCLRMMELLRYYQKEPLACRFSDYKRFVAAKLPFMKGKGNPGLERLVDIIAYCLMPTHLHLVLRQRTVNGISVFMGKVLNSYSRYFNLKHKRKGPLWEGPFKNVLVETDEQLLHLTRYVHLNPVTAQIVDHPESWPASSYREYVGARGGVEAKKAGLCNYAGLFDLDAGAYKKFSENRIDYQRALAKIKHLLVD